MFLKWTFFVYQTFFLIEQISIVKILAITVIFFLILLILGVRKSIILKKENERLSKASPSTDESEKKPYQDFTEGHMYNNN
ncbi:hypothetical protein SAMN04487989_102203 [Bizionia echini]|uniref:Uncharacterized protein n=1 Tax=Bizionia echini TaxID=649333 RepID=A0A1I5APP8_9FLAO|nr:hypothetical protein [Bizionia echini]SFN64431.1 hypothetical protein SAMN04487989_102203 [Bizionia echini]